MVDSTPTFPKLPSLQPAGVFRQGAYQLRAPAAIADVVFDVLLRDLRVRSARRPHWFGVACRRADADGLGRGRMHQKHADSASKNSEWDSDFHMAAFYGCGTRIHLDRLGVQCAFGEIGGSTIGLSA